MLRRRKRFVDSVGAAGISAVHRKHPFDTVGAVFSTEIVEGPSFPATFLQTLLTIFGSIVIGGATFWIPCMLDQFDTWIARPVEAVALAATGAGLPYLVSRQIGRKWPAAIAAGTRVGLLPSFLLVVFVIYTKGAMLAPHARGPATIIWLAYIFLIYPLFGCVGYSLGMRAAKTRLRGVSSITGDRNSEP